MFHIDEISVLDEGVRLGIRSGLGLHLGALFTNAARAVPTRTAVAVDGATMTFADVESSSNRLARHLAGLGVARGDRVALWSSTVLEAVPLFAALAKLGAVFVPLNGLIGAEEVRDQLVVCRPAVLLVDDEHRVLSSSFRETVLELGESVAESGSRSSDPLPAPDGVSGADVHTVFFTSGSTGRPKGVVLSHETNYLRTHPGALLEPRGPMVCPYPLFHMGAWTIALQQWQARDAVVLVPSDAESICDAVARFSATRLNCIPAVWRRILDLGEGSARGELDSIRFADTGTSSTPPELLEAIGDALPAAHLRVFYGSTEAGIVSALDHADLTRKPGSCGVPAPGVEVRADDSGEVWVRSSTLFSGYLDDPVSTAEAVVDGWYRTGDLAEIDEEGYLRIVGRAGEVIRTGGEAVVPAEVETVLRKLPGVIDVAVVGLPDDRYGELVCAVVVTAPSCPMPQPEDVRSHCDGRLARFKHPRRLVEVAAIPRTSATGQVQRGRLVEELTSG